MYQGVTTKSTLELALMRDDQIIEYAKRLGIDVEAYINRSSALKVEFFDRYALVWTLIEFKRMYPNVKPSIERLNHD